MRLEIEENLRSYMRWNAMAMVVKANRLTAISVVIDLLRFAGEYAGHSFNHFWRANRRTRWRPAVYSRSLCTGHLCTCFLEGRISEEQLLHFRREVDGKGFLSVIHIPN
jgi:pyruvate dehydrogenase E1 component